MSFIQQLMMSQGSTLGYLFYANLVIFLILGALYGMMILYKKETAQSLIQQEKSLLKLKELYPHYTFEESSKTNTPWGISLNVTHQTTCKQVTCFILHHDIIEKTTSPQFEEACFIFQQAHLSCFAPIIEYCREPIAVFIELPDTHNAAKKWLSCQEAMLDQQLNPCTAQALLIRIGQELDRLHQLKTSQGQHFFHGCLSSRSVFFKYEEGEFKDIMIFWSPFSFVCSNKIPLLTQKIHNITTSKRSLEQRIWIENSLYFPPEYTLMPPNITLYSDIYAFGKLTSNLMPSSSLPTCWSSFLEQCLRSDPMQRPQELSSLEDFLTTQEALHLSQLEPQSTIIIDNQEKEDESVHHLLGQLKKTSTTPVAVTSTSLEHCLDLVTQKKYKQAQRELLLLEKIHPLDPQTLTYLAICYYELKQTDRAYDYYEQAKKLDPQTAQKFRHHTAYRL